MRLLTFVTSMMAGNYLIKINISWFTLVVW